MSTRHSHDTLPAIGARLPRYTAQVAEDAPQAVKDFAAASEAAHVLWLEYVRTRSWEDRDAYRLAADHAMALGLAAEKALRERGGGGMMAFEALTNAAIGLAVSWTATSFVLGYSSTDSAAITAMFFGLSFGRSYLVRRLFAWLS